MVADRAVMAKIAVVHGLQVDMTDVLVLASGRQHKAVRARGFLHIMAHGASTCYVLGQACTPQPQQRFPRTSTVCREEAALELYRLDAVVENVMYATVGGDLVVVRPGLA